MYASLQSWKTAGRQLVIVQLDGLYLKNVEHLQYCFSLKICILSNDFIKNIDSLVCCPHLVELDLHGNREGNAEEALSRVKDVISKISHVLAHRSPIIIVQRWIRGYLTRERLGKQKAACHLRRTLECISQAKLRDRATKVLYMNDFKEVPRLCLGRERQPITSTLPILQKKGEKINIKQERSPWRKGPLKMENTDMEKQTQMKFSTSTPKKTFHPADKLTSFQDKPATWCDLQCHFHSRAAPQSNARDHPTSLEKRVFAGMYGPIRFGPFYVIDKFYSENKQHDSQAQKLHKITQMRTAKEKGSHYIQEFLEEKQRSIQKKSEEDGLRAEKALQQHEKKRSRFIENVRQRHTQFLESKKQKAFEYSLGQDFSARHIALTQGLLKLDRWRRLDDGIKERQRIVEESREQTKKYKQLIKNFQDQRQLRIQKESLAEKTTLSSVVSQKTNERLQEAKANVERVKEHRAKMECLYKAPVLPVQDI
ncbi:leucine-rich repeat and IQ domain-containing protein 3 [Struthio camelus]|uniref:leucine-rich repeat and IQ domain-containing protein 3 n=1 Tax=Struthio camelus TaxID=8801 RepID=UPI003603B08E